MASYLSMKEFLDVDRFTFIREAPVQLPFGKPIPTSIRGFMWAPELIHLNQIAHTLLEQGVPGGVLEVGSYCGLSACALAQPGPLTCIDTFGDSWGPNKADRYTRDEFDANMKLMDLHPRVLEMDSREALPKLQAEDKKFRLILIDGGHSYMEAHPDFMEAKPLLSPGGLFAIDDWNCNDVLRAAIDAGLQGIGQPISKLFFAQPRET
jgi:hypothetical protein